MARNEKSPDQGVQRAEFRRRVQLVVQCLRASGWTQTDIGDAVGCKQNTVSDWTNPEKDSIPKPHVLLNFHRLPDVNMEWLLLGKDAKTVPVSVARASIEGGLLAILEGVEHLNALADERRKMLMDGATSPQPDGGAEHEVEQRSLPARTQRRKHRRRRA